MKVGDPKSLLVFMKSELMCMQRNIRSIMHTLRQDVLSKHLVPIENLMQKTEAGISAMATTSVATFSQSIAANSRVMLEATSAAREGTGPNSRVAVEAAAGHEQEGLLSAIVSKDLVSISQLVQKIEAGLSATARNVSMAATEAAPDKQRERQISPTSSVHLPSVELLERVGKLASLAEVNECVDVTECASRSGSRQTQLKL